MSNFQGTRALITGGSSGIGLALARRMVRRGIGVAIAARDAGRLAAAKAELDREGAGRIPTAVCDVADAESIRALRADLSGRGFVPDTVVNAAGVVEVALFAGLPSESFRRQMEVNFHGAVEVCRTFLPPMIEAGRGWIVNIASVAAFTGIHGYSAYSASKFALLGFSESLRCEMKPLGIYVGAACPPDTDTPMLAAELPARPPETRAVAGSIRPWSADAVARVILDGMDRGRFLIIPGAASRAVYLLKHGAPRLWDWAIDRRAAEAKSTPGSGSKAP